MSQHSNEQKQNDKGKKVAMQSSDTKQDPKVASKQDAKQVKLLEEKIKTLESDLQQTNAQLEETKTKASQYLSTASYYKNEAETCKKDLERYKERNKSIESEAKVKANDEVAHKIIPIIDNFDQAISHVDSQVMKGFSMIYQSLTNVLTELGIEEIHCKGEELSGEFHNCISTEPTDDAKLDGKVASVYQKGYMFAGTKKVVRPATVSVYKKN